MRRLLLGAAAVTLAACGVEWFPDNTGKFTNTSTAVQGNNTTATSASLAASTSANLRTFAQITSTGRQE